MTIKGRTIAIAASSILKLLLATVRLRITDRCGILSTNPPFPLIFAFWHNRILAITPAFQRHYPRDRKGVSVLTSPSRDGEILARIMAEFGMGAVRGSSSRRGARALLECRTLLESGRDLAVTPDGPRGPRHHLGPGLLLLSQQTGARIAPIHARFSRAWEAPSWDGFRIPFPFSRIDITLAPYEMIPPTHTGEAFENERHRIENLLRDGID